MPRNGVTAVLNVCTTLFGNHSGQEREARVTGEGGEWVWNLGHQGFTEALRSLSLGVSHGRR